MAVPLTSVPGQRPVGLIDGYLRLDAGDGTLGLPDYSRIPYTYLPALEADVGGTTWSVDEFRPGGFGAFKGSPDGLGAFRDVSAGGAAAAYAVEVIPQATGTKQSGARSPDTTWGPQDVALAVRHPGTATWDLATRTYVTLDRTANTIGMRLTTPLSIGSWDAEAADSAAVSLANPGWPQMWDGNAHTISVAAFGQNILCTLDYKIAVPFRAPRAYHRYNNGTLSTVYFSDLPSTGAYGGFDARGTDTYLYEWRMLAAASGDCFYYDLGPLTTQTAPGTTYTPTVLASGEAWSLTGTVSASKNGILLSASSTALFTVPEAHGLICTKWGTVATGGGVVIRRQDASNYYLVTSTGIVRYTAGTPTTVFTYTTPIAADANVVIYHLPAGVGVYADGVLYANWGLASFTGATTMGFLSPAAGTSQFRYIAFQPIPNPAVIPTT